LLTIDYRHNEQSKYTRIGYYLTILAVFIQGYLWIMHIQDTDSYSQSFSYIAFWEFLFALVGLLLLDPINHRGFHLRKKTYTPLSGMLLIRIVIILVGMAIIQFGVQFLPLTVKDPEIALAIIFAGPSEENFFRGILISVVILVFSNIGFKFKILKKELSIWVIFGIILSSIAFAGIHVNYYDNMAYLFGTFLCGLWLGFTYWYWEDLTANIMAHFLLNFIVVFRTFFLVQF